MPGLLQPTIRIFAALIVCLLFTNASFAVTSVSGDFVSYVGSLKQLAFGRDSGLYVPPTMEQQSTFRNLAESLSIGDTNTADALAGTLGYEVIEFTDTVTDDEYLGVCEVLTEGAQVTGWGSYFVNLNYDSNALLQSPHPVFELNSWEITARAFQQSSSRGFLMAGSHRHANGTGTADVAHLEESIFQEVHEVWNGSLGQTTAWQIHGFGASNSQHASFPDGTKVVLTNGDGGVSTEILALDSRLDEAGQLSYAYNTLPVDSAANIEVNDGVAGSLFASLGGTQNKQGVYSRDLGGTFVHIEFERSIRDSSSSRLAAALALADAIQDVQVPAGDYNLDGSVNLADYTMWRNSLGSTGIGLPADGNGDAVIDAHDYNIWKNNFGISSATSVATLATVPEPDTRLLLTLFALAIVCCCSKARQ